MRFEWQHLNEKELGVEIRGPHGKDCHGRPLSRNGFDVEANLKLDYVYGRAWAEAHFQFDNSAGISNQDCCCDPENSRVCSYDRFHGSGDSDALNLKRAFIGYTIFDECGTLEVEVGRRKLYDIFESDIQFLSRFDGIVLRYSDKLESVADWYFKIAGFVVDERVNHFSWITEVGFENLWGSSFDIKYSYIDWAHRGRSRCGPHKPFGFDFHNSQVYLEYVVGEGVLNRPAFIYGAVVYNHTAHQFAEELFEFNHHGKKDKHAKTKGLAWYAGVLIGKVRKEGDWSVEVEYQYVEKNSIPYDDQAGCGLGNARSDCCPRTRFPLTRGYQGWEIEALYALTDNLTVNMIVDSARSTQSEQHTFSKCEVELIYAF